MVFKDDLFLITGATGNTGAPTVEILRAAGRRVRAFVHERDAGPGISKTSGPKSLTATCRTSMR